MARIGMSGNFAGAVEETKCIIGAYCKAGVELNGITQVNFVGMFYSVLPGNSRARNTFPVVAK